MGALANQIVQGVLLGGLYALFAMGLSLSVGIMRFVNIAHGDFIVLASFVLLSLTTALGISPLLAMPLILPLAFIAGFALQRLLLQRVTGGGVLPVILVMVPAHGRHLAGRLPQARLSSIQCEDVGSLDFDARNGSMSPTESAGAQGRNRTSDTRIFSPLLYQLSYLGLPAGIRRKPRLIEKIRKPVQPRKPADNQLIRLCFFGFRRLLGGVAGNPIALVEPAREIDVGTPRRAERPIATDRLCAADRTTAAAFSRPILRLRRTPANLTVPCEVLEFGGHHASSIGCRTRPVPSQAEHGRVMTSASVGPRRFRVNSTKPRRDMAPTQTGAESSADAARRRSTT